MQIITPVLSKEIRILQTNFIMKIKMHSLITQKAINVIWCLLLFCHLPVYAIMCVKQLKFLCSFTYTHLISHLHKKKKNNEKKNKCTNATNVCKEKIRWWIRSRKKGITKKKKMHFVLIVSFYVWMWSNQNYR